MCKLCPFVHVRPAPAVSKTKRAGCQHSAPPSSRPHAPANLASDNDVHPQGVEIRHPLMVLSQKQLPTFFLDYLQFQGEKKATASSSQNNESESGDPRLQISFSTLRCAGESQVRLFVSLFPLHLLTRTHLHKRKLAHLMFPSLLVWSPPQFKYSPCSELSSLSLRAGVSHPSFIPPFF